MKDKIKSYNMTNGESYRNKIKGHVQIDLHDTRTGFNERIKKDNLVTNALDNYIPFCLTNPNSYFSPIATNALGGIMLFDGEITEDASNIFLPSDAHIVGMAGSSAETDSFFGTFNTEESEVIENGYKSVWDFTTSQCNGQIGSVARTHASILQCINYEPTDGTHELGSFLVPAYVSNSSALSALKYDIINGFFYFFDAVDSKVKKIRYFKNKLGACDEFRHNFGSYNLVPYEYEEVADLSENSLSGSLYRQPDGYAYQETDYRNSGGITISLTMTRVDCNNFEVEKKSFDTSPLNVALNTFVGASNGYFYYTAVSSTALVKINWSNPADMSVVIDGSFDNFTSVASTKNGIIILQGRKTSSKYKAIYVYPDGTVILGSVKNSSPSRRAMQADDGSWFLNKTNKQIINRFYEYLGTIANVGPFQKNSTQTMKITYSLTNASS